MTHPVDFKAEYKETTTGIQGKCTSIGYKSGGNVLVALTWVKNDEPKSLYFDLTELESVDGSRLELNERPEFPGTFLKKYKDAKTELVGNLAFIMYSANGCIQGELIIINQKGEPKSILIDMQDLTPVDADVPKHNITNQTNPGAPRAEYKRDL